MKAAEVINEIKAMAPAERARVLRFVHELEAQPRIKYVDKKIFKAAADRVFKRHEKLLRKLAS